MRSYITLLVLVSHLLVALSGGALVLCKSIDGHHGIELAHVEASCKATIAECVPSDELPLQDCNDTPLADLLAVELITPRSDIDHVILTPPAVLPSLLWSYVNDICVTSAAIDRPLLPPHRDAVQSIVLLI